MAAAVVLEGPIEGLKDSKKLTKLSRSRLAAQIENEALAIGIGWVSPADIDISGITTAVKRASQAALDSIEIGYDQVIIDGSFNFLASNPKSLAVVRADDSVPCVSAASIIAKVARDNYMSEAALSYPLYGFESHVGYGTAHHLLMMQQHGLTPLHRRSFKPVAALL